MTYESCIVFKYFRLTFFIITVLTHYYYKKGKLAHLSALLYFFFLNNNKKKTTCGFVPVRHRSATEKKGLMASGRKRGLEHLDEYEPKAAKTGKISLHDRMAERRLIVILEGASLETVKVRE